MSERAEVVSVRGKDRASLSAESRFVYVGRRCGGWPGSVWGNPFKPGMNVMDAFRFIASDPHVRRFSADYDGNGTLALADSVAWYEAWVRARPDLMRQLSSLAGKRLGCWCGDWDGVREPAPLCHAVVLARLAEATTGING